MMTYKSNLTSTPTNESLEIKENYAQDTLSLNSLRKILYYSINRVDKNKDCSHCLV